MPTPETPISNQEPVIIQPGAAEQIQQQRLSEVKQQAKQARKNIAYNRGVHQDNTQPHSVDQTRKTIPIYPPRTLRKP